MDENKELEEMQNIRCGPFGTPTEIAYKHWTSKYGPKYRTIYALFKDGRIGRRQDLVHTYSVDKGKWDIPIKFKEGITWDNLEEKGYTKVIRTGKQKEEIQYASLTEKIKAESKARRERYALFEKVYNEALKIGREAAQKYNPVPMHVYTPKYPFGDESIIDTTKPQYIVKGGVCGFAWIHIPKANNSFVRWLQKKNIGHKSYYGGWDISIMEFGQSMECKEVMAREASQYISENLKDHDVYCYCQSRMD